MSEDDESLRRALPTQIRRIRSSGSGAALRLLLAGGSAGLLFVIPLVAGAYLGRWLDERATGYSTGWTVNLILVGLAIGVVNVVLFFREHWR